MAQLFVNNGETTLSATLANGATSATIANGSIFPAIAAPDYMVLTLDDGTNIESIKVGAHTASSTTISSLTRGYDGTTQYAGTWAIGTKVECRLHKGAYWPNTMERETFSNANYTIAGTADRVVAQIGTMSAVRTVTLPAANGKVGQRLVITDESGSVTQANCITISRSGTDTIGPGTSATSFSVFTAGSTVTLVSDGSSKWNVVQMSRQRWTCTSTTAWVCPPGVFFVSATLVGGGGGGGGCDNGGQFRYSTGGGGGQVKQWPAATSPGTSYTCTIGSGGSGGSTSGTDGSTGGNSSWFGVTAYGGGKGLGMSSFGGTYTNEMVGAYGGNAQTPGLILVKFSTNATTYSPYGCGGVSDGSSGTRGGNTNWGKGGGAPSGGGASWGDGAAGATNANGSSAGANTGGGGGGGNTNGSTAQSGGSGGSGYGEIEYGV